MSILRGQRVPTDAGFLNMYAGEDLHQGTGPVVVMLPGALRTAKDMASWWTILREDAAVVFFDLPGHRRSDRIQPTGVEAMARVLHQAVCEQLPGRKVLLVGESLGGTIAFRMAGMDELGPIVGVVAFDPPLTTAKLWPIIGTFKIAWANEPDNAFYRDLAWEVFGIAQDGSVEDRIYYDLVGGLRTPAMLVSGDMPLPPPRPTVVNPSMVDEVDAYLLQRLFPGKLKLRRIVNTGHLLLHESPQACLKLIRQMLAEHARP